MKRDGVLSGRVYFLIAVMGLWAAVIGVRLYFLQVVHSAFYHDLAEKQQQQTLDLTPRRGTISDRNGSPLAVSVKVDSVFAIPSEITDTKRTAKVLSGLTGISAADLLARFDKGRWMWVQRKISKSQADAIAKAKLEGIHFQKEDRRYYPKRTLAASVLGHVNVDEEGMGGLEFQHNDRVRGETGEVVVARDARGRRFSPSSHEPEPGASLITTLDENEQFIVEKELQAAVLRTRAKGIAIGVMDPHSGEMRAMATYPTFDPNEYWKADPASRGNRVVSQVYEPGSTFKILTIGAALEENLTTPDELIDCLMGSITLFGRKVNDHKKFGVLSVREIMQFSSDVGVIKLGLRVGDERFSGYIDRFGYGHATGIDLPGEERGLIRPVSRWDKSSIGSLAMGQEIGVTPLQILSMVSAVANGGILYRPYVTKKIENSRREVLMQAEPHGERVMTETTARQLQDMLEVVVTDGTAKTSKLDGYRAAGKTGTAQKIDPQTKKYSKTKYVASFAGYAPASNPAVAIIVVVDEPMGLYHGGEVAGPIFKNIAEQILRYRTVMPDVPQQYAPRYFAPTARPAAAPKKTTVPAAVAAVRTVGIGELGDIEVPDFQGNSLRQVDDLCSKLGLKLLSTGSGRATAQFPLPGTRLRAGAKVQVSFSVRP